MLTLTATVLNVFPTNEYKDSKTGEVTPAGHKVQLQFREPIVGRNGQEDGEKIVIKDLNVRELGEQYKKVIGKTVAVPVGVWVDPENRKPGLYVLRGSLPTVVGEAPKKAA